MAWEIAGDIRTFEAGGDLSSDQHRFVMLSAGKVIVCTAVTDKPVGILQNKPAATGRAASVMIRGCSKVIAAADLAVGNEVGTDDDGEAVAYVHGTDSTKYIVGYVVDENANAGELATIEFNCVNAGRGA